MHAGSDGSPGGEGSDESSGSVDLVRGWFNRIGEAINSNDPHSAVEHDVDVHGMHDRAEMFEGRTEGVFRYLQVSVPRLPPVCLVLPLVHTPQIRSCRASVTT